MKSSFATNDSFYKYVWKNLFAIKRHTFCALHFQQRVGYELVLTWLMFCCVVLFVFVMESNAEEEVVVDNEFDLIRIRLYYKYTGFVWFAVNHPNDVLLHSAVETEIHWSSLNSLSRSWKPFETRRMFAALEQSRRRKVSLLGQRSMEMYLCFWRIQDKDPFNPFFLFHLISQRKF